MRIAGLYECKKCGIDQPASEYAPTQKPKKRKSTCRTCFNKRVAARKAKNPDHKKNYADSYRKSRLKVEFGITVEDYDRMFDEQKGLCAICEQPETRTRHGVLTRLAIDHDHETYGVRGLLCAACNAGLGLFQDRQAVLQKAIDYLDNRKGAVRGSDFGSKAA